MLHRISIVLIFLVSCAPPRASPAADQLAAWLAAFNTGDRATLLAYHQDRFAYDRASRDIGDIDRELRLAERTGGFELERSEPATSTRVVSILRERGSKHRARAVMEVEPAAPHRVRTFEIGPIDTAVARMAEADALAALRAELDAAVARDQFAGAVVVARHGTPIFAQAYGYADRARQVRNTLDTRFRIGSMNKMFTAVAILQLVQAGKLALTDTLERFLSDLPFASKVTIHQLLTHTGGTGDFFGPAFEAHRHELQTLADYVRLLAPRELRFTPGSKWEYSNLGFLLLGVVIEQLTGLSYYDVVDRQVFRAPGMTSTSSPIEAGDIPGRAVPYTRARLDAPWASGADQLPYRATSAGGGDSTVGDLLRFANALQAHQLLDAEHTKLLTTGKVETLGRRSYAYGFEDATIGGVRCVGHNGGSIGQNGRLYICDSGYTVIVLANVDPPAADRLADFINVRLPATAP